MPLKNFQADDQRRDREGSSCDEQIRREWLQVSKSPSFQVSNSALMESLKLGRLMAVTNRLLTRMALN